MGIEYKEASYEQMLQCDGEIMCEHWLLSNSRIEYGIDLQKPYYFNEFLHLIGTHLTSFNCKTLMGNAKWYVIDDGVQI